MDKSFTPDAAASGLTDGSTLTATLLDAFPYIGLPYDGFHVPQPMPTMV